MRRRWVGVAVAGAAAVVGAIAVSAQQAQQADPASCQGLLAQSNRLAGVLSAVPRYGSSYVLVVPQRLAEKVPNVEAPAVKDLQVGVHSGTPAGDAARAVGITRIKEYRFSESALVQPLQDVKDGSLDAAIMWAPLAGLGIIELGLQGQVSIFTIDKPHPAPTALRAQATADPCAMAILDELDASGVLPAELLIPVEIRSLLTRQVPRFNLAQAREGGTLYNQLCSRCHGPDAVADPKGLAPVDLRISMPRFSYPGFSYIILNGRPEKGMPPLRGTVTDEQIALMYQYLKARTEKLLPESETRK